MKKTFESLKIWRILPALLFFMTCGVFITYAVKGDFYGKYSTNTNNILTDAGWNYLMNDLDNLIPTGTIMAFARESCPGGWTLFTGANGKFLMGTNNANEIGNRGGSGQIILRSSHLPPHQHYLRYGGDKAYDNPKTNYRSLVVDWNGGQYPWDPENTNYSMSHGAKSNSYYDVSTAPYGNGWGTGSNSNKPINIQNPYIKVLYCIKGNYSIPEDSCPSGYSSSITSCNGGGYTFHSTGSTYGSMTCGKCTERPCGPNLVKCELPRGGGSRNTYLWNETIYNGVSGNGYCVNKGCCITASEANNLLDNYGSLQNHLHINLANIYESQVGGLGPQQMNSWFTDWCRNPNNNY